MKSRILSCFRLKDNKSSLLRAASDQWKRERPVLHRNYKLLIMCTVFQLVHNLATNLARSLHVPQNPLYDLGFVVVPRLDPKFEFLCDVVFSFCILITIIVWMSPFLGIKNSSSVVGIGSRFFAVLVLTQSLRILTFLMTDLPGPSPRCKPDHPWYNQPKTIVDILWRSCVGIFTNGCGELVFSSRMLIIVLCLLTVARYGKRRWLTLNLWLLSIVYGILMIAARREYSLSIFIAWYTVPLVWVAYERHFPDEEIEILPTRQPKDDQ
mmetsp:Transcript_23367/g.41340  ORF Transcript_23367/g.41340 Transcript_23367/m.41340 type:complete len:267 (+) Transcript_23367:358-1158(+)